MTATAEKPIVNIAGYYFADLPHYESLRDKWKSRLNHIGVYGTILLTHEGINIMLAGTRQEIDDAVAFIRSEDGLQNIAFKESYSARKPFRDLQVKLKKATIPINAEPIRPDEFQHTKLEPQELKKWYDEGKDFAILDTRNDYEARFGTFKNAIVLDLDYFRYFPEHVAALAPELKDKPVVTFCTGGIRCEKAAPHMLRDAGFKEVYQLEGGILKYFEETGGAHYEGDCYVFDYRVALDKNLNEVEDVAQCKVCKMPLKVEAGRKKPYVDNHLCPHCQESGTPLNRKAQLALAETNKA